ncbi:YggS family pyridoxal phosphate-dependent enzyme [Falsibacillus albus]|uniref:Pyridoxal phosphate homeostasis protein n=1 Tax=Falsibacillus albus TaxID=2478915 RepID=A0A3L7JYD7_9BACI|nr:YggS family pyridoxal phosphate-dependent enzyme [Falsibacillus albus]RLQ95817.1 YggS family pyridoxal phosphate-dependent enzyme [Falsibacillus albus]
MKVTDKMAVIQEEIDEACRRSGRNPGEIEIIAVTKYVSVERAKEALSAGLKNLGENRDDGLLEKWDALGEGPIWHFIGSLQTRKVKNIINKVQYIHSLDRLSLAKEINKRADKPMKCFVQVNTSGEESKHGLDPEDVINFVEQLMDFPNISIVGLMTMAPFSEDRDEIRKCFAQLKDIQTAIKKLQLANAPCEELSMGMSNDFQIAIEEGATFIRIGTSLVGENS